MNFFFFPPRIRSIFNNDDLLCITFTSGTMILLNISTPHVIYTRNISWIENKSSAHTTKAFNHINTLSRSMQNQNDIKCRDNIKYFAQQNGQMIEIATDYIQSKSFWEYFIHKKE